MKKLLFFIVCVQFAASCTDDSSVSPDAIPPQATWRIENPVPVMGDLSAVWGSGSRDVFAVCSSRSEILHYDGDSWTLMLSEPGFGFDDVWGTSPRDVYAVGSSVFHHDGSGWKQLNLGLPGRYRVTAVWGSSASDVYFAGYGGFLVHFDGNDFMRVDLGTNQLLIDVWSSGPDDVYVLGYDLLYHFDGSAWDSLAVGDPDLPGNYRCITGHSRDNVFMSGRRSAVFDGNNWRTVPDDLPFIVEDMWCAGHDEYYAAAGNGVYRFDGRTWQELFQLPTAAGGYRLSGVWGDSRGTLYGVADDGAVWVYRNGEPEMVNGNVSLITTIWTGHPMEAFFGTERRAVFRWDGQAWHDSGLLARGPIFSLWGRGADRLYAADGIALYRYNGTRWDEVQIPAGVLPLDMWEFSRRTLFVVGRGGLAKRDERGWSVLSSYVGRGSVWGRNAADVFAATQAGLFHHDGEDWTVVTHEMEYINDLWGLPTGHVYAAASTGLYVHFQGEWNRVPATPEGNVETVWGTSPDALYFLDCGCASASVYFNNGLESEEVYRSDGKMLKALWGTSTNNVYAGGTNGLLIHYSAR